MTNPYKNISRKESPIFMVKKKGKEGKSKREPVPVLKRMETERDPGVNCRDSVSGREDGFDEGDGKRVNPNDSFGDEGSAGLTESKWIHGGHI